MSKVITTKRIRVTSRGRYPFKNGVILGPERFFHKEEVSVIKELFSVHPKIIIEEYVKENNSIVILNTRNYNTDNYRPPINMEGDDEELNDNVEETPESEEDTQAEINSEEPAEDGNGVVVDNTTVGNDSVIPELPETPENEEEDDNEENDSESNTTAEENQNQVTGANKSADISQQQNTNNRQQKKNKNKNKNKDNNENQNKPQQQGSSVEVTPKEA